MDPKKIHRGMTVVTVILFMGAVAMIIAAIALGDTPLGVGGGITAFLGFILMGLSDVYREKKKSRE